MKRPTLRVPRRSSSAGQSNRLVSGRSSVRIRPPALFLSLRRTGARSGLPLDAGTAGACERGGRVAVALVARDDLLVAEVLAVVRAQAVVIGAHDDELGAVGPDRRVGAAAPARAAAEREPVRWAEITVRGCLAEAHLQFVQQAEAPGFVSAGRSRRSAPNASSARPFAAIASAID